MSEAIGEDHGLQEVDAFIERWGPSGGAERANYQLFLSELTDLLGVERPLPATADGSNDHYRFERPVVFTHTARRSTGSIDLYRRDSFVLETKQGVEKKSAQSPGTSKTATKRATKRTGHGVRGTASFDDTMLRARNQADGYARAVSKEDGWPPFLLVVDVGHIIEIYADFSRQGQGYTQFPDGTRYRIKLEQLRDSRIRDTLRTIWTEPQSLDPALQAAEVTREIAVHLAHLGRSLEAQAHSGEDVANFLMRCLFTMFAEDVELIPKGSFTDLLKKLATRPADAKPAMEGLWATMDTGGFSQVLLTKLMRFNGGLFKNPSALPLNNDQLELLIEAAETDWTQVEPAIFGTLLERALDKRQRHKLGAHYTPRAYVERLVTPTIMEPLRDDWRDVQTAVQRLVEDGKQQDALALVHDFHRQLCSVKILDPACGSGNFLYVALEMMKRLEGEVTALLEELGETQASLGLAGMTVDPHQFLGIELNPWAAAVAELVLWIGYLQWHFRTHGKATPSEPVLRDFKNIENRDAILEWSGRAPRLDERGEPVTRWDGVTTIRHSVTREEVPDPSARVQVYDYADPKATTWPDADFIVGNPPFIGASRLRESLGDGYIEALWEAYPKMPQSADLVMFWWDKAALAARVYDAKKGNGTRRFGLITTNSLRQTFNRRVLEPHLNDPKKPLSLLFAIPDHPWVDTLYGAAVRIAMTVGGAGNRSGRLLIITSESKEKSEVDGRTVTFGHQIGKVFANLRVGPDVVAAKPLVANEGLAHMGMKLHGKGFIVGKQLAEILGRGSMPAADIHIKKFFGGRDLAQSPRGKLAIDLYGLAEAEVRKTLPAIYQHLLDTVKPERMENNRASYRDKWWVFGEPRSELRPALSGLSRRIATTRTGKHRVFQFLPGAALTESEVVNIALEDAIFLAILSSRIHEQWTLAKCGWHGVGNDPRYNHSLIFSSFPFPSLTWEKKTHLRMLGEELDQLRKRQQESYPNLTVTQMYNVLGKIRVSDDLVEEEKNIYDQGLIGILRDLHDQIDAAVADAYGWPHDLSDEDILFRLVALNKERAEEEAHGHIRWLRPDYQNPDGKLAKASKTEKLALEAVAGIEKAAWPKTMPEQIAAVREALKDLGEATPEQVARRFKRARATSVEPLLESLAALGQAEMHEDGRYVA